MRYRFWPCIFFILFTLTVSFSASADDGYRLWQRYEFIKNSQKHQQYQENLSGIFIEGNSPTLTVARQELEMALTGLLGKPIKSNTVFNKGSLVLGTPQNSPLVKSLALNAKLAALGPEGFLIESTTIKGKKATLIVANSDVGVLYGTFHFLKLLQTNQDITQLSFSSAPKIQHRILNHWDSTLR